MIWNYNPDYYIQLKFDVNQQHRRKRAIRSFIIRGGRLTQGQQNALDTQWSTYGCNYDDYDVSPMVFSEIFDRDAPTILEIGFGDGEALFEVARKNPDNNYIGIEVHRPGVGHLLMLAVKEKLENLRVFCEDGNDVLQKCIADATLDKICLYFPDPWPKKKHHKRRILQPDFIELLSHKLKTNGVFHYASDWRAYADEALVNLDQCALLLNQAGAGNFSPRPEDRPLTKFEKRGHRLGHGVWDILMTRIA